MNQRSDIDRLLRHWMDDGPSRMPDRIVDVVADRISVQRQRRSWRLLRRLPMNALFKLGAAAAAALVIAVVGYNLLPRPPGPGADPSPSASPTATPASTPVATGPVALHEGILTGGRYRLKPLDDPSTLTIVADVPAGWQGFGSVLVSPGETTNTGIMIGFFETDGPFSDPCHWDRNDTGSVPPGDVVVGPTVDDLVAALQANSSYTASSPIVIMAGDAIGKYLELQLPGDEVLSTCDRETGQDSGQYFVFPESVYAQGPNSRWRLWIRDVHGTRLITLVSIAEGTPEADIAAAEAIVASFEFTP